MYMTIFYEDQLKAIVDEAWQDYLEDELAEGEERMARIAFMNDMVSDMWEHEDEEVQKEVMVAVEAQDGDDDEDDSRVMTQTILAELDR